MMMLNAKPDARRRREDSASASEVLSGSASAGTPTAAAEDHDGKSPVLPGKDVKSIIQKHARGRSGGMDTPGKFDFSFAWNSPMFADRTILLEVQGPPQEGAVLDGPGLKHVHLTSDTGKEPRHEDSLMGRSGQLSMDDKPKKVDRRASDSGGRKGNRWLSRKWSQSGDQGTPDSNSGELDKMVPEAVFDPNRRVLELQVISAILASKSEFFYKQFSQAQEAARAAGFPPGQREICSLRISSMEEAPFLELLRLIYQGASALTPDWTGDVERLTKLLEVAHKFGVRSCLSLCVDSMLKGIPNSVHKAKLVLGLPMPVQQNSIVKPLVTQVRDYLAKHFQELEKVKETDELLDLPMSCLEAVLESDGLRGASEATVFNIVLRWCRRHYEDNDKRAQALAGLAVHVRFPWIDGDTLLDAIGQIPEVRATAACEDLLYEGVRFRAYSNARRDEIVAETTTHSRFRKRPGMGPLISVFTWDVPIDICETLVPNQQRLESPSFFLNGTNDLWLRVALMRWKPTVSNETCRILIECDKEKTKRAPTERLVVQLLVRTWPAGEYTLLKQIGPGSTGSLDLPDAFSAQWGSIMRDVNQCINFGVLSLMFRIFLHAR